MRKCKVSVITLLVSFKFSVGIFINHCLGNMLKTKKIPIRKTIIKVPW